MKKLIVLLFISILVFSCEKDEGVLVPNDEQNVEIRAKKNKVQICHKLGNGQFKLIEVNGNAEQAHINHGDGYPGECYNEEGIIAGQEFMSGECILITVSDVVDGCDGLDNNCDGIVDEDCITCIEEYADCELCIYMQPEENIENTCGYNLAISFGATILYNDGTQISIGSFYDDVEDVVIYNYSISFPDGSIIGILEENPNEFNTCWDIIAPLVDFKGFDACLCEFGGNCQYTVCLDNDGDGYGDPNNCMGYHSDIPPPGYANNYGDCDDEDPTIQTNCSEPICPQSGPVCDALATINLDYSNACVIGSINGVQYRLQIDPPNIVFQVFGVEEYIQPYLPEDEEIWWQYFEEFTDYHGILSCKLERIP